MSAPRSLVSLILCACSGGGGTSDAPVDIDNGTCGAMLRFTGEYVTWDSETSFCGVFGARFVSRDGGGQATTAPNGRFDLCVPDQPITLVDITPPASAPDCVIDRSKTYPLPGIAIANREVILAGAFWSGRAFLEGQETFDPTKAHIFVHVNGPTRAISLDGAHAHGPIKAMVIDTWAPGNIGHEVFIPDVDPAGASAMLLVSGGAIGAGAIPLVAGKMTTLSILTR